MSRICGLIVLGLLAVASPVQAQDQQTNARAIAELEAEVERLTPLIREAEGRLSARVAADQEMLRNAAREVATVDTFQAGLVTVITPVEQLEVATELFTEVWSDYYADIETSQGLSETIFTFQWSDAHVPIHVDGYGRGLAFDRWMRRPRVKRDIRDAIGLSFDYDLRESESYVGRWARDNPYEEYDHADTYRVIATTSSRVTRNCIAGDVPACGSALGLDAPMYPRGPERRTLEGVTRWEEDTLERMHAWYTPDERRSMVVQFSRRYGDPPAGVNWRPCVDDHVLQACDELLRAVPHGPPLPGSVRGTLLAYALQQGGRGAWGRLLENPEVTPTEALEYASAMPIGDLLSGWRAMVISARPDTYRSLVPRLALAMLWVLFFIFLTTRSTRWRLG